MNDTGISIALRYDHWCTVLDTCEGALSELRAFAKSGKGGFASRQAVKAADDKLSLILQELLDHLGEFRSEEASDAAAGTCTDEPSVGYTRPPQGSLTDV